MSLFVVDTTGNENLHKCVQQNSIQVEQKSFSLLQQKSQAPLSQVSTAQPDNVCDESDESEDDGDFFGLPPPNVDLTKIIDSTLSLTERRKTKVEEELELVTERVDAAIKNAKDKPQKKPKRISRLDYSDFNATTGKFDETEKLVQTNVEKELQKSALVPGLEQLKELPRLAKQKQRALNRAERDKTKGSGWFNLPATEVTEEVENDLKILQMRSVLDPKHFYKKNDLKVLPKYFQIGTVQHSPLDHYSERNTRKNKKRTLVDELLADSEAQMYTKRKYNEIMARKDKYAHRKTQKKMKKLKKNK